MSRIIFSSDMEVELVDHMGTEESIVRAARVSTLGASAEASESAGLVRFLMREGHGTPFEACVLTFRIHAPIFVTRQLLKHRMSSINEESGRYRELEPKFYVVPTNRKVQQVGKTGAYEFVHDDALVWLKAHRQMLRAARWWAEYRCDLADGMAKEVARMEAPMNLYSTMYMTANLRSWLNVVKLRTYRFGSHPQYETAEVGEQVYYHLSRLYPTVMDQFSKESKI